MDYTIMPTADGPQVSFEKSSGLFNNVFLSLAIGEGDWWFDPSFGLKKRKRLKNTPATARLLEKDHRDALQWMLDTGRATTVTVVASPVDNDRFRLQLHIEVTAADGEVVTYDKFVEVV